MQGYIGGADISRRHPAGGAIRTTFYGQAFVVTRDIISLDFHT
jgi:hypothetical protein